MADTAPQQDLAEVPGVQFKMPSRYLGYMADAEKANSLPPGSLNGIFAAENAGFKDFNDIGPHTASGTGARGPFQLTPSALKDAGYDPKTFDWRSFKANAEAAGKYSKIILDQTEAQGLGGVNPHLRLAGGYNMGYNDLIKGVKDGTIAPTLEGIDAASAAKKNGNYVSKYAAATPIDATESTGSAGPEPTPQPSMASSLGKPIITRSGAAPHDDLGPWGAAGAAAKSLASTAWDYLGKPVVEGVSQFPRELADNARALSDRGLQLETGALDSALGTNASRFASQPTPFQPIDPMGAVNFATSIALPETRMGNAALNAGTTVLNAADARARQEAAKAGLDWNGLGTGDRVSRVMQHMDSETVADNMPSILTSAGLGSMLTPSRATSEKVAAKKAEVMGQYEADKGAIDATNQARQDYGEYRTRKDQWGTAVRNAREEEKVSLYNAGQDEQRAIDQAAQDAYSSRLAKVQPQLDSAKAITGLDVLPNDAWGFEKKAQNIQARDMLMGEFGAAPENPAKPIFEGWLGTWDNPSPGAQRPLDPASVEAIDSVFDKVRAHAKASNRADTVFAKLGQRLGDPQDLQPQIDALEAQIGKLGPGGDEAKKAILEGKIQDLEGQLPTPTVGDLINRVQAIDQVRRTKAFSDSATPREVSILTDVSNMLRKQDGLVMNALTPDEAKIWTQGNMTSLAWWNKKRTADLIMGAFGAGKPGASDILNRLATREAPLRKRIGDQAYGRLHELAGAVDTLMMQIPPRPAPLAKANRTFIPDMIPPDFVRNPHDILTSPKVPSQDEWANMAQDSSAVKFINGLNTLFAKVTRAGVTAAAGAGGLYAYQQHASLPAIMLSGAATAAILATPELSKAVVQAVRYMDHPESRQYLNALAKLSIGATLHNAYQPQAPPLQAQDPMAGSMPPTSAATPRTPTKLANRPTGGPMPAPPTSAMPTRTPPGLSVQALR